MHKAISYMAFFGRKDAKKSEMSPAAEQIKNQTAQEIATADVSELVNNMTKDCFHLCFDQLGSQVTTTESRCTENCVKKFMAAWNLTSQVYVSRLQQEH